MGVNIVVAIVLFVIELLQRIGRALRATNPGDLKTRYYTCPSKKMKPRLDQAKEMSPEDQSEAVLARRLRRTAARFIYKSDLTWGGDFRSQHKSAWWNVLAADVFKALDDDKAAGNRYHFAGHAFRMLNEYESSHECYVKSAHCFARIGDEDDKKRALRSKAIRSIRRAIGVLAQVSDKEMIEKLEALEVKFREDKHIEYPVLGA